MNIVKVVDLTKTKISKSGKEYHPSYFLLELDSLNDGVDCSLLVNFPFMKEDRKLIEAKAKVRYIKPKKEENA